MPDVLRSLRARYAFVPGRHRPRPIRNGAVFLVVVGVLVYSGFTKQIPLLPPGGQTVTADFERLANVRVGTNVRVHGVNVGKVEEIGPAPGGRGARVVMRIDDEHDLAVREDARAGIWWRTLLGRNMYIDLDPGSPSAPPLRGRIIPKQRTETQIEIDELLAPLGAGTRASVQTALQEFDAGFASPTGVRRALRGLDPAMRATARGLPPLRGQEPGDLGRLVGSANRAMGALARTQDDLAGLVEDGAVALGVTAARRADLGGAVDAAPGALSETSAVSRRLRQTLDALDPVVAGLRPGVRELPAAADATRPALTRLDRVLVRADPLLRELRPAVRSLTRASRDARPLLGDLDPTLERAERRLVPWLQERDPVTRRRNVDMIGPTFATVDSATAQFDVLGNMVRFSPQPGERPTTLSPCVTFLTDPSERQKVNCDALVRALETAFGGTPARRAAVRRRDTRPRLPRLTPGPRGAAPPGAAQETAVRTLRRQVGVLSRLVDDLLGGDRR